MHSSSSLHVFHFISIYLLHLEKCLHLVYFITKMKLLKILVEILKWSIWNSYLKLLQCLLLIRLISRQLCTVILYYQIAISFMCGVCCKSTKWACNFFDNLISVVIGCKQRLKTFICSIHFESRICGNITYLPTFWLPSNPEIQKA